MRYQTEIKRVEIQCNTCCGSGWVTIRDMTAHNGHTFIQKPCPDCNGAGKKGFFVEANKGG